MPRTGAKARTDEMIRLGQQAQGLEQAVSLLDARRAQCPEPHCAACMALLQAGTEILAARNQKTQQISALLSDAIGAKP